ncbi:acetate kinase [Candidatus Sumerlaeota bacterium]|nr:acetate kinase [Candidatus Sumerlaeota bacterium]
MKVLVLNCGSSSVKFQLIETSLEAIEKNADRLLARGGVEKIGAAAAIVTFEVPGRDIHRETPEILEHREAIACVVRLLTDSEIGVVKDKGEIEAVGHRVVHGGEKFATSTIITDEVAAKIKECIELAPLHNPANIRGYIISHQFFSDVPHCAVFDTAFHQTMPEHAYLYAIPRVLHRSLGVRRYGFHGTSHRYVARQVERIAGRPLAEIRVITAHLGNGCSITAIAGGKSVDTSMGFTPLEGLIMGTRSGDIDAAAVLHVIGKQELRLSEANAMLNKHSGLLGISGRSNDMRELTKAALEENDRAAALAIEMFSYRLRKYIGAYAAAMGGVDHLAFTGGIGENSALVREKACQGLEFMGLKFDPERNADAGAGGERVISTDDSPGMIHVIPTNEELVIARDTVRCIEGVI